MAVALPPGVQLVRAPNPGPMTLEGTNTWVLRERAESSTGSVVVDPGPLLEPHLRTVLHVAGPVAAVVVTHQHPDHAEGAAELARLAGAPLLAHAELADRVPIGSASVLVTPGHTADSICLRWGTAVLTGDTVLGRGSTVIDPRHGGRLGDYLASLERLAGLGDLTVLPGHGPVLPSLAGACRQLLAHRRERLQQVREALQRGAGTAEEVVATVYPGLADDLVAPAVLSTRAAMDLLAQEA